MVYSNYHSGEKLSLKYFNLEKNRIFDVIENIPFESDMIIGDGFNSYNLNLKADLPVNYNLSSVYPNPFNLVTNINFSLPSETKVLLSVYDMQGREVARLVDDIISMGYHSIEWNVKALSSGVYILNMVAGEYSSIEKIVLMK